MSQATISPPQTFRKTPNSPNSSAMAVRWGWLPVATLIIFFWPQLVGSNVFYIKLAAQVGILILLTASLNLALGYTDLVSMAQSGLFAIGAYTVGLMITRLKLPFLLSLPLAFVGAGLVGALITLATLRAAHLYFAMITLSFNLILIQIALAWTAVTNGEDGVVGIPRPTILDWKLDLIQYFYLIWVLVGVSYWLIRNIVRSKFGRSFLAIRGDEETAATLGVAVFNYKLVSFTLSAGFAGMAGALYSSLNGFVNPSLAALDSTLTIFVGLFIGGAATLAGPVLGVIFAVIIERLLVLAGNWINQATETTNGTSYQVLAYGIILLLTMTLIPRGIVGTWLLTKPGRYFKKLLTVQVSAPQNEAEQASIVAEAVHPIDQTLLNKAGNGVPILKVSNLVKRFGGLRALNGVNLQVEYGEIHGLIGPNGSGKSTFVNTVSGYMPRTEGNLEYGGMPIAKPHPHKLARWGIVRIFQASRLFGEMTVLENMLVGLHLHTKQNFFSCLLHLPSMLKEERVLGQKALVLLAQVGLEEYAYQPATILTHGQRRLLEVARALAVGPALLILDEPATGLTAEELRGLSGLIDRLKAQGVAILLIEHNMDFLMKLAERVTCFNYGEKLAEGLPEEVQRNSQVITAYLGADEDYEEASTEDVAAWSEVGAGITGKE